MVFGTDPKTRLSMPLLPTTIRSAPTCSATSITASAGSVDRVGLDAQARWPARRRRRGAARWPRPRRTWPRASSPGTRAPPDGHLAGPRGGPVSVHDVERGSALASERTAMSTASSAVSEPSVPTTMLVNIGSPLGPACDHTSQPKSQARANSAPPSRFARCGVTVQGQRKSNATFIAPESSWVARAVKADRQSSSGKV